MCVQVCVHFHSCSIVCKCVVASILVLVCSLLFLFMCVQVCVHFHTSSSLCKCVFTSILIHVCSSVCSLPFLFYCVQVCVCFHSSSSVCKCVFTSILVLLCASGVRFHSRSCVFASIDLLYTCIKTAVLLTSPHLCDTSPL